VKRLIFCLAVLVLALAARPAPLFAQAGGPLRLEITEGVIEPMPIAVAPFLSGTANAGELAARISAVVVADLAGSGLFRAIPAEAQIAQVTSFDAPVRFADWKAINAQALMTGTVERTGADRVRSSFRAVRRVRRRAPGRWDAVRGVRGRLAAAGAQGGRHRSIRLTGEPGYFDSRIVSSRKPGRRTPARSGWR
jgi:TolB protein